jgi:hypothetical protein
VVFSVGMQHSYSLEVGGSQFAEPRRNSGKDVWRIAMRATQLRSVARQASKTLSMDRGRYRPHCQSLDR